MLIRRAVALLTLALLPMANARAAVHVIISTGATISTQSDLLADLTNQYVTTVVPTPYFAGSYNVTVYKKNAAYIPPPSVSSPVLTGTAVDQCMAYGFGNGMDAERYQTTQLIWGMHADDVINGTCAGDHLGVFFNPISTGTVASFCHNVYGVIVSSISQRWGYVYDPKGARTYP